MKSISDIEFSYIEWKKIVNNSNRFYNGSKLLKLLIDNHKLLEEIVPPQTHVYRGRIFDISDVAKSNNKCIEWINSIDIDFQGYAKAKCGAPESKIAAEGRLNGQGISYLYTCSELDTVMYELRPTREEIISVAEFETKRELVFANLTRERINDIENKEFSNLIERIAIEFSTPHYAGHSYYFTQYLAGQFMNLGYDGIIFESSLRSQGKNLVFFRQSNCEAINSRLYCIDDICVTYSPILRADFQYLR